MPRQAQLSVAGQQAAPLSYTVPGAQEVELVAANATFDGTSAAGSFLPALEVLSDSGHLVSRSVVDSAVAAGGSAEVTFAPFLRRSAGGCCTTAGSTYAATVNTTGPQAAWPLTETSGTVAHDETGNGHDLTEHVFAGGSITWASATGPPGTPAPRFAGTNSGYFNTPAVALAPLTDNFAVALWVNYDAAVGAFYEFVGEGESPIRFGINKGWSLIVQPAAPLAQVYWGDGAAQHSLSADVTPAPGTWFHLGWQSSAGTKTLWVNGVQQAATSGAALAAAPATQWWIGYDFPFGLGAPADTMKGLLSWVVRWPRPLTAGEWASLATAGGNLPAGYLLQSNGAGGSHYAPFSSGSAPAGDRLTADGAGGTYWAP